MTQVIVYDLDDTLYPVKDFAFSGFNSVSQWLEKTHFIGGFNPVIKEFYNHGVRGNLFNTALNHMAINFDQNMIQDMINVYRQHIPKISLLPEAEEIIKHFGPHKKQALLTDGYLQVQKNKIDALNLHNSLNYTLCTDSLGSENWKPSPTPFLNIMDQFNLSPNAFTYIGDNPIKDFIAPNNLGWKTIRIQRPDGDHSNDSPPSDKHAPHHTIQSLLQLKDLI